MFFLSLKKNTNPQIQRALYFRVFSILTLADFGFWPKHKHKTFCMFAASTQPTKKKRSGIEKTKKNIITAEIIKYLFNYVGCLVENTFLPGRPRRSRWTARRAVRCDWRPTSTWPTASRRCSSVRRPRPPPRRHPHGGPGAWASPATRCWPRPASHTPSRPSSWWAFLIRYFLVCFTTNSFIP